VRAFYIRRISNVLHNAHHQKSGYAYENIPILFVTVADMLIVFTASKSFGYRKLALYLKNTVNQTNVIILFSAQFQRIDSLQLFC